MATAKKLPAGSWRRLVYDYTDENGKRIYRSFTSDDPSPATIRGYRNIQKMLLRDHAHSAASIRHALGIPDAYIMQEGGWKTDAVLKSVYRHAISDRQKEMASLANNYFSRLCNTKK